MSAIGIAASAGAQAAAAGEAQPAGLLMQIAEAQQRLAEQSFARLEAHVEGLDAVVRDELRRALTGECGALGQEAHDALDALGRLKRAASVRLGVLAVLMAALWSLTCWVLLARSWPSAQELAALRSQRSQLLAAVDQLTASGALAELRRCGSARRLCVRIDLQAPAYGRNGDYRVLEGY